MTIILVNPNATVAMTDAMLAGARRARPGLTFEGWTSPDAPPAIEGPEDAARAMPALMAMVDRASATGAEAIVIACFDDPGLAEARARASCPVIGAGEAALTLAALAAPRIGIVTTVEAAVPVIAANVARMGLSDRVDLRAAGVPVLDLEAAPGRALERFGRTADAMVSDGPGFGALVLGCAGAGALRDAMADRLGLPVFDGITAAAGLCAALEAGRSRTPA